MLRIDEESRELDPRDFHLIVSLGSEHAAFDASIPWIERERLLLRAAREADVPVLGLCFGSQLLARALGGDAFRSERSEIGWLPVRTRDESLVPSGPWLQWHYDTFTPPPGSRLVADSPVGPQAYVIGRSLGAQFHPEVTPEIVEAWLGASRDELVRAGIDPDRLLAETNEHAGRARAAAWRLFDAFLERVAGLARRERRSPAGEGSLTREHGD